jgi:AcrR family transcriptional regulator
MNRNTPEAPSLRERRRQETADLILDAAMAVLTEHGIDALTVDGVAERVGISARTVYRYFPDRGALLTAAMSRHNEATPYAAPTSPEEIGNAFGRLFAGFDDQAALRRVVLAARISGTLTWDERLRRIAEIEVALRPAIDHLPRPDAVRATAVIVYLANSLAWLSLADESGLDGEESGAAITWAIDTLVADLRRRNDAAMERDPRQLR